MTLYCSEHDVAPLSDYEYYLLDAIKSREARYDVFQKDLLDWGSKLKPESYVYVTLPSKAALPNQHAMSVIRYIGPLPNEHGVLFGVEIMVSNYNTLTSIYPLAIVFNCRILHLDPVDQAMAF